MARRILFQGDKLWWGAEAFDPAGPGLELPGGDRAHRLPAEARPPEGARTLGLREAFTELAPEDWAAAGRAQQWLSWSEGHRHCGACGVPLEPGEGPGRRCPGCGLQVFPGFSSAIIVLIRRGRELLLARSPHFKPGVYSAIAGFVEPGETLEAAVHREVAEELGVCVHRLRYFQSQPWPFPNGLMIGFFADYLGGELRPDPAEIEDARWFNLDALPSLPSSYSVARWLIETAKEETL